MGVNTKNYRMLPSLYKKLQRESWENILNFASCHPPLINIAMSSQNPIDGSPHAINKQEKEKS